MGSPSQFGRGNAKSSRLKWLLIALVLSSLFLFRKSVIILGVKLFLNTAIPTDSHTQWRYEQIKWEGDELQVINFQWKTPERAISVDRSTLTLHVDWQQMKVHADVALQHPQVTFEENAPSEESFLPLPAFITHPRVALKWTMQNGVIQFPATLPVSRLFFSFQPGVQADQIGTFLLSYEPMPSNDPIVLIDLSERESGIGYRFELIESDCGRLIPLLPFISSAGLLNWKDAQGQIQIQGHGTLKEHFCSISGQNLEMTGFLEGAHIAAADLKGEIAYCPSGEKKAIWEEIVAQLQLTGGQWSSNTDWSINDLSMTCTLTPTSDPDIVMDGAIVHDQSHWPIHVQGKGGVQEDGRYWLETRVEMPSDQDGLEATLSLCRPDDDKHILQIGIESASAEHIAWIQQMVSTDLYGQCESGTISGKMLLEFSGKECTRYAIEEVAGRDLRFKFLNLQTTASVKQMSAEADVVKLDGEWVIEKGSLSVSGGDLCRLETLVSDLNGDLQIASNELLPSRFSAQVCGSEAVVHINGTHAEHLLDVEWEGNAKQFLDQKPMQLNAAMVENDSGWDWIGECMLEGERVEWGFELQGPTVIAQIFKQNTGWTVTEGWLRSERLTEAIYGPLAKSFMGDLHLTGDLDFFGTFKGSLWQFSVQGNDLCLQHPRFTVVIPQLGEKDAQLLQTEGRAVFSYDAKENQFLGEFPIEEGKFIHKALDLSFESLNGKVFIKDSKIDVQELMVICQGLEVEGALTINLINGDSFDLSIETDRIEGDLSSLKEILSRFPDLSLSSELDLEGHFSSGKGGLALHSEVRGDQTVSLWSFGGQFSNLHIPISERSYLADGCCELYYDAYLGELILKNGKGEWVLADGTSYQVHLDSLEFNPKRNAQFDLKILDAKKEIGRFHGAVEQNLSAGWDLSFNRDLTHFYGTKLQMGKVVFSQDGKLLFFEMHPIVRMQDLQKQLKFMLSSGLFASVDVQAQDIDEWQLTGELKTAVTWEKEMLSFRAQGSNISVKGYPIAQLEVTGRKMGNRWTIDQLHADKLNTTALFEVFDKKIAFSQLEGSWNQIALKGSGDYQRDLKTFSIRVDSAKGDLSALSAFGYTPAQPLTGAFALSARADWQLFSNQVDGECAVVIDLQKPFPVLIKQDTPIRFTASSATGLHIKGIDSKLFVKTSMQFLGSVQAEAIANGSQCDLKEIQFSFSPELVRCGIDAKILPSNIRDFYWESYLEGKGELTLSKTLSFRGSLRDGRYGMKEHIYSLQQIGIGYENDAFQCHFKTILNEQPLWGNIQVDLKGAPVGAIQICDHLKTDGILAAFRSNGTTLCWESIQGIACGIDVQLKKSPTCQIPLATVLTGSVKIDGSRLDALLPKEMKEKFQNLKLGKGYEFRGDLVLSQEEKKGFQLDGQLLGHQFELLGYQFDSLNAIIEANPDHIQISKLNIDDESGFFQIKKIAIEHANQRWSFYIPLLQVKDLQPSMMKKNDQQIATVKPLVIRNLSLSEIRGDLNDPRGWEGEGHLNFTNAFRKESTLFETPIEMVKNLGLDPGLLTPVQGEIQLELRGDKFYLVSMKNAYSDAKRAQFFLSPADQTSFIDLNGNVHIDIKMRQDVVLKLTEAFTLTVRGTLDKPRYGLQY